MIRKVIKDRESFIIKKHSLEIETVTRIESVLNFTLMVSSKQITIY